MRMGILFLAGFFIGAPLLAATVAALVTVAITGEWPPAYLSLSVFLLWWWLWTTSRGKRVRDWMS